MKVNARQSVRPYISSFDSTEANFPAGAQRSSVLYRDLVKRTLDLVLVLLAAPIISVTVGILCLILATDGGNPFYAQERVGLNGRLFRMWKLRSMVVGADKQLQTLLATDPAIRLEWSTAQKLKNDPRITRFGRVLRKCSLDELPQLWNVLVGDMSLVGPRPMMPCQRELYPGEVYYRLRPGITGMWQVSSRNQSSFAERAIFDLEYDRNLSFRTDLVVLLKTIRVVVQGTGC